MKKLCLIAFCFCVGAALFATLTRPSAGQDKAATNRQGNRPADQSKAGERDNDDVVKISVTLVQVDAVVTDRKGRHVADLKPEDFEISEDGKRQHITNFSFVAGQPTASTTAVGPAKQGLPVPPMPARLRPEQVRRTIALVVDDLGLSYESTSFVRDALKKFVEQQMQEG